MGMFAYNGFEVVIIVIGIRGKNSLCTWLHKKKFLHYKKEGGLQLKAWAK
jgi:hypothetical protein